MYIVCAVGSDFVCVYSDMFLVFFLSVLSQTDVAILVTVHH